MRVTTRTAVGTLIQNLDRSFGRITQFQKQLSSGSRLNTLSDDPAAVERTLALRSELRNIEQFQKNIDDGSGWLELSETTLSELETLFVEARGLGVQGASDTYDVQQRKAVGDQIDQFLEHAVSLSEARYRGRYIFAGTQTGVPPYDAIRERSVEITDQSGAVIGERTEGPIKRLTPQGATSGTIEREVSDGVVVQVNVPGEKVFEGSLNAFSVLQKLRDALWSNDVLGVRDTLSDLSEMRQ